MRVKTLSDQNSDGLRMIFYQRGAGNPDERTYAQMKSATGLDKSYVIALSSHSGEIRTGSLWRQLW